jgi:predicted secreted protein
VIRGKETVQRSKKFVFVSHCIICQSIRAQGVSIRFPAIVNPIVRLLMENDVNIVQMPCPEMDYEGVIRKAVRKDAYDNPNFRKICRKYAEQVLNTMKLLSDAGYKILGILGIENSPTCGVKFVFRNGKGRVHESGVFIEELQKLLSSEKVKTIPFLGIQTFNIKKSVSDLKNLIHKQTTMEDFSKRS